MGCQPMESTDPSGVGHDSPTHRPHNRRRGHRPTRAAQTIRRRWQRWRNGTPAERAALTEDTGQRWRPWTHSACVGM